MNKHIQELIDSMQVQERIDFYGQRLLIESYEIVTVPGMARFEFKLENMSTIVIEEKR
jgi:hypothetical protein